VRNPENGHASICPEFAGDIFICGGFNEKGITISELTIYCDDTTFEGANAYIRMRMVLDYADDYDEALEIMNSNRTYGNNFVIGDANEPIGVVNEQTKSLVYSGTWDDPAEGERPFWQVKDYVRRGNCFINRTLAKTERTFYNIGGLFGFLMWILFRDIFFVAWSQYKAISREVDKQHGTLDVNSSLELLRDAYKGKTDIIFGYIVGKGVYQTWHQWAGSPETGDIAVCFAEEDRRAFLNEVHYFNFYDLLNSTPP
jgi:hypothetical protein